MDIISARALLAALGGDVSLFGYSGRFLDEHSARLIELGQHWKVEGDAQAAKGRAGYVMVEAYQNIIRHRAPAPADGSWEKGRSLFIFRTCATGQILSTRNVVRTVDAGALNKALETLRAQDAKGLKELFMEGIQRSSRPGQRGAGLGLIEITRRAGRPPGWAFLPLEDGLAQFILLLELGTGQLGLEQAVRKDDEVEAVMLEGHISLFHVGVWSAELAKALVAMAQVEVPPRAGRQADRESVWGLVSSVFMPAFEGTPVLFMLHGRERPMLSIGGVIDDRQAGGLHAAMQGTDVEFSFGDGPGEGKVLAFVHVPW